MATGILKDVEEDAVYIQTQRFNEYEKQFAREQEKKLKSKLKVEAKTSQPALEKESKK